MRASKLLRADLSHARFVLCSGDAVLSAAVQLYNSWALDGRDVVMEATHGACVEEMIEIAIRVCFLFCLLSVHDFLVRADHAKSACLLLVCTC